MYFQPPHTVHPEQYKHLLPVCFRLSSTNITASNFKTHSSRLFSRPINPCATKTLRAARSKRHNFPCRSQMKIPRERRQHTQGQNEIGKRHMYPPSRARTAASDSVQSTAGREHERYPTLSSSFSSFSSSSSCFHAPPRTEPTIAERCSSVHAVVVAISVRG